MDGYIQSKHNHTPRNMDEEVLNMDLVIFSLALSAYIWANVYYGVARVKSPAPLTIPMHTYI